MPRRKKVDAALPKAGPERGIRFANNVVQPAKLDSHLTSFDLAIGGGIPERSIVEVSGYEGVGKSTVCDYLLGINGGPLVAILPFELYDPAYLVASLSNAGFAGEIWEVPPTDDKGKVRDDEAMLDALADKLYDEDVKAILLDSVGAISPVAEEEGSVREANMGRRARIMGPFLRKVERALIRHRKTSAIALLTNHSHPLIGAQGTTTSGGQAVKFHPLTRVRLTSLENYDDGSKLIEGKVLKCRFRLPGVPHNAAFRIMLKVGQGVHVGLSAVQDCVFLGLAEQKQGRIELDGKSYGFLSKMIYEKYTDQDLFAPFLAACAKQKATVLNPC